MIVTIELPDDLAQQLRADARTQGRDIASVVYDAVAAAYGQEHELSSTTVAALEQGLADLEAGRTFSLEEVRARTDAALAARRGKTGT